VSIDVVAPVVLVEELVAPTVLVSGLLVLGLLVALGATVESGDVEEAVLVEDVDGL
jgi:hypothetical protein